MLMQEIRIVPSSWQGNRGYISHYYRENKVILDSYLERLLRQANHYQFLSGNQNAGCFAIGEEGSTLVFFHVMADYAALSQQLFLQARHFEMVTGAMLPTGDEQFLSLAVDNFQRLEKQAYFALYTDQVKVEHVRPISITPLAATKDSYEYSLAPDFLGYKIDDIQQGNKHLTLYSAHHASNLIGFGNLEYSTLTDFASTGMFVFPEHRQKGYGKSILWQLNKLARAEGAQPISGCWYYNHNSKKSMEAAGGYSGTRLLRFYF